jgi:alginate O-acetyltransferase complex protein AlgI
MVFSSVIFIFSFLPIVLFFYYVVPNKKWKNLILFVASLVFYAWGEPVYIFLMIFSTICTYLLGLDIAYCKSQGQQKKARNSMIYAIVLQLVILGFFKYYGFVVENINQIFNTQLPIHTLSLPVGISFYTFQSLSYIVDLYKGEIKVQKNYFNYGLYVAMFPQLVAGPIVRYADIEPQLLYRKISKEQFGRGVCRFIIGLGKKVIFADQIGQLWTTISAYEVSSLSVSAAWLGILAYTLQLYFDFSGYSDMAIGLGHMFGFTLRENFKYPYLSDSITEFWRRWHISLGTWFREYIYIPLGGNRVSTQRHICNILIVWMVTGLWHGANWNFVFWGLYYGLLLLAEKFLYGKFLKKMPRILQHLYTMFAVIIGWVFFASDSLLAAFKYIGVMFGTSGIFVDSVAAYYWSSYMILMLIMVVACSPLGSAINRYLLEKEDYFGRIWEIISTIGYVVILIVSIVYLVTETYHPFLYFRF